MKDSFRGWRLLKPTMSGLTGQVLPETGINHCQTSWNSGDSSQHCLPLNNNVNKKGAILDHQNTTRITTLVGWFMTLHNLKLKSYWHDMISKGLKATTTQGYLEWTSLVAVEQVCRSCFLCRSCLRRLSIIINALITGMNVSFVLNSSMDRECVLPLIVFLFRDKKEETSRLKRQKGFQRTCPKNLSMELIRESLDAPMTSLCKKLFDATS